MSYTLSASGDKQTALASIQQQADSAIDSSARSAARFITDTVEALADDSSHVSISCSGHANTAGPGGYVSMSLSVSQPTPAVPAEGAEGFFPSA